MAVYTAKVTVHGGRQGKVESTTGGLDVDLVMPKELGGGGGTGTNPEELFAAVDKNGTSDPYVRVRVGNRIVHKSKTITKTLAPTW